jgi:hypothetical protein
MGNLIILAVEAAEIAACSENRIALRRCRMKLSGGNHWQIHAAYTKLAIESIYTAFPLAELAVFKFPVHFHIMRTFN